MLLYGLVGDLKLQFIISLVPYKLETPPEQ